MLNSFMTDVMAMLMASLPSLLNTRYSRSFNPASIKAVRRSESVIHSGFLTTEVTGDGKTGCDDWHPWTWQTATCRSYYRTINKYMEVDHRRWVVQEAVHQGLDLITHVMAVMCLNIFVFSLSLSFFLSCPASLLADSWTSLSALLLQALLPVVDEVSLLFSAGDSTIWQATIEPGRREASPSSIH